jgi:hypothetical protein
MGFDKNVARKAIYQGKKNTIDEAIVWIEDHQNDEDFFEALGNSKQSELVQNDGYIQAPSILHSVSKESNKSGQNDGYIQAPSI